MGGGGLQRFRPALPLAADVPLATLGEGNTPLVTVEHDRRPLFCKLENLNPTGSYKDRGTVVLASALAHAGVRQVVEDSSGNAGASLAGYAARLGIAARIFIPSAASGPKRDQIAAYGGEVVAVPGPRSNAAEAVLAAVEQGAVYASHVYQPHALGGYATIAYEIVEQLGRGPGSVLAPLGHGSLLLGLSLGFQALRQNGRIDRIPRLFGVQAAACAPVWAVHRGGAAALLLVAEGETAAEGIRVRNPLRGDQALAAIELSGGTVTVVEEAPIEAARRELAQAGIDVEPTSAVVWPALDELGPSLDQPTVVVLTGAGWKSPR
jgi:threonine synthase